MRSRAASETSSDPSPEPGTESRSRHGGRTPLPDTALGSCRARRPGPAATTGPATTSWNDFWEIIRLRLPRRQGCGSRRREPQQILRNKRLAAQKKPVGPFDAGLCGAFGYRARYAWGDCPHRGSPLPLRQHRDSDGLRLAGQRPVQPVMAPARHHFQACNADVGLLSDWSIDLIQIGGFE